MSHTRGREIETYTHTHTPRGRELEIDCSDVVIASRLIYIHTRTHIHTRAHTPIERDRLQ